MFHSMERVLLAAIIFVEASVTSDSIKPFVHNTKNKSLLGDAQVSS